MPSDTATSTRSGLRTERTALYRGGVSVSVMPFPGSYLMTLTVRKERELGRECWRPATFSTPMCRLDTVEDVATYGCALILLAEIGAELDVELTG